jgi:hypothetical protein
MVLFAQALDSLRQHVSFLSAEGSARQLRLFHLPRANHD